MRAAHRAPTGRAVADGPRPRAPDARSRVRERRERRVEGYRHARRLGHDAVPSRGDLGHRVDLRGRPRGRVPFPGARRDVQRQGLPREAVRGKRVPPLGRVRRDRVASDREPHGASRLDDARADRRPLRRGPRRRGRFGRRVGSRREKGRAPARALARDLPGARAPSRARRPAGLSPRAPILRLRRAARAASGLGRRRARRLPCPPWTW